MANTLLHIFVVYSKLVTIATDSFWDEMYCHDCEEVNEDCEITKDHGFFCESPSDSHMFKRAKKLNISGPLEQCILPGYFFISEVEIANMCCFWSPKVGCQMLQNKKVKRKPGEKIGCFKCASYKKFGQPRANGCPCELKYIHSRNPRNRTEKLWGYYNLHLVIGCYVMELLCGLFIILKTL